MNVEMNVVLDSVCLNSLTRIPSAANSRTLKIISTNIDGYIENGILVLVLDDKRGLLSEWEDTCGRELVGVLLNRWEAHQGVVMVRAASAIPHQTSKALRALYFRGTVDKLIVRIAMRTDDKTIVSNDDDFWEPNKPSSVGNQRAPVCALISNDLGIKVTFLKQFMQGLKKIKVNN